MTAGNGVGLIDYDRLGPDAALSIPNPEHYLPLLYVLGALHAREARGGIRLSAHHHFRP